MKNLKVITKQEIGNQFTQKVAEFIANGFIFNFADSTRGTQGEEMKVNLTNDGGNTVYLIRINQFSIWLNENGLELVVEKFVNAKNEGTLWQGKGEIVYKKRFYSISRRENEVFVDNKSDWESIKNLKKDRLNRRFDNSSEFKQLPTSANKGALKLLKKIKGCKSKTLKDISATLKRDGKYFVQFANGQKQRLN